MKECVDYGEVAPDGPYEVFDLETGIIIVTTEILGKAEWAKMGINTLIDREVSKATWPYRNKEQEV